MVIIAGLSALAILLTLSLWLWCHWQTQSCRKGHLWSTSNMHADTSVFLHVFSESLRICAAPLVELSGCHDHIHRDARKKLWTGLDKPMPETTGRTLKANWVKEKGCLWHWAGCTVNNHASVRDARKVVGRGDRVNVLWSITALEVKSLRSTAETKTSTILRCDSFILTVLKARNCRFLPRYGFNI